MIKNIEYDEDILKSFFLKQHIQTLEKNINERRNLTEKDFNVEMEIIQAARGYEHGEYKQCRYIKPNEAYNLIVSILVMRNKSNIENCIKELENSILEITQNNWENVSIVLSFLKKLGKIAMRDKNDLKTYSERCGVNYGFFSI